MFKSLIYNFTGLWLIYGPATFREWENLPVSICPGLCILTVNS